MYRYFVLLWDDGASGNPDLAADIAARLAQGPHEWTCVLEAPGVLAFHAGVDHGASRTLLLDRGTGAIFGTIFRRSNDPAEAGVAYVPHIGECDDIVRSGGRLLIQHCWGRYVALVRDPATRASWVLRDPSGGLPCLLRCTQGVQLVFSDLKDCLNLGPLQYSINWRYIRRWLVYPGLQVSDTGLEEISEVQPGERLAVFGASLTRSLEWNPLLVAASDCLDDPRQATRLLRDTVRASIFAWAACYPRIIHHLSGGLDSSIVLSCLMDAPSHPTVTCLNYFGAGPGEDERAYARRMAARARVDLIEHELQVSEVRLEPLLRLCPSARPWFYLYELEHGCFERELAAEHSARGLFSGGGGDGVFYQSRADLALTDYLIAHGPGPELLSVAVAAARLTRTSVWRMLFRAWREGVRRPRWRPIDLSRVDRGVLSAELCKACADSLALLPPWYQSAAARNAPPGLLWHAQTIAVPPAFYPSFADESSEERTMPLLAQPLVELCLKIPTYRWIAQGVDRALARAAFEAVLPPEIVRRAGKGRIDRHVRQILDANLRFVRELLLDGHLVREGLLDRERLELYLTAGASPIDHHYTQILQIHLCVEAWLQSWSTR